EVDIKRRHKVGEYPVVIKINGVISDFKRLAPSYDKDVQTKLDKVFSSQESYDEFTDSWFIIFKNFVERLEQSVRTHLKVDDVIESSKRNIIRPKEPVKEARFTRERGYDPIYYGYYGFHEYFWYSWMWAGLCHSHSIHVHNFDMVDDYGQSVMTVGDGGFNAGDSNALNPSESFEAPTGSDVSYHNDSDYSQELSTAGVDIPASDSGSGGYSESFDLSDSGSSCSSCSSCGGGSGCGRGCGGGCGGA
ncbi:MAG: hypothetical protein OEZ36_13845, partial [Spirochaetota bacterium]|nr:hypothetical protein [Spirochaetota bacterium]